MADAAWLEYFRWIGFALRSGLPQKLLRLNWPDERLRSSVRVMHFEQSPRFYVQKNTQPARMSMVGFTIFNLTPIRFSVVGANLRIGLESRDWFTYDQRLSAARPLEPWGISGIDVSRDLADWQAQRLRDVINGWIPVRVTGHLVLQASFGELTKEVHSDVIAVIERGQ